MLENNLIPVALPVDGGESLHEWFLATPSC